MKSYKIVLSGDNLRSNLDRKIIVDFVSLLVKFGVETDIALYSKNVETRPLTERTYFITCPEELSANVKHTYEKIFPIEIDQPKLEDLTKLLGT